MSNTRGSSHFPIQPKVDFFEKASNRNRFSRTERAGEKHKQTPINNGTDLLSPSNRGAQLLKEQNENRNNNSKMTQSSTGENPEDELLKMIRDKIQEREKDIRKSYKVIERLSDFVEGQEEEFGDFYEMNLALESKLQGLEAAMVCLNSQSDHASVKGARAVRGNGSGDPLSAASQEELLYNSSSLVPEKLDFEAHDEIIKRDQAYLHEEVVPPTETEATVLVERLNRLDAILERNEKWRDALKKNSEEYIDSLEKMELKRLEINRKIKALEQFLQEEASSSRQFPASPQSASPSFFQNSKKVDLSESTMETMMSECSIQPLEEYKPKQYSKPPKKVSVFSSPSTNPFDDDDFRDYRENNHRQSKPCSVDDTLSEHTLFLI